MTVVVGMVHKIYRIDSLVEGFFENFNKHYSQAEDTDFYALSLTEQVDFVRHLYKVRGNVEGLGTSTGCMCMWDWGRE